LGTTRIEGSYRCRACQSVFKLDKSGRPQSERQRETSEPAAPWQPRAEPSKAASRRIQAGVLLAAAASLALLVGAGVWVWQAISLPSTLPTRAVYVADAFVYGDRTRLVAFIAPNMRPAAEQWQMRRPERWTELLRDAKPRLRVTDVKQGATSALVLLEVTIARRAGSNAQPASADKLNETTNLTLCWTLGGSGQWLFDAESTLKTAPPRY
jgi:hypothetical protein